MCCIKDVEALPLPQNQGTKQSPVVREMYVREMYWSLLSTLESAEQYKCIKINVVNQHEFQGRKMFRYDLLQLAASLQSWEAKKIRRVRQCTFWSVNFKLYVINDSKQTAAYRIHTSPNCSHSYLGGFTAA